MSVSDGELVSLWSFVVLGTGDCDRSDVSDGSSSSFLDGGVGTEGFVGLRSIIH